MTFFKTSAYLLALLLTGLFSCQKEDLEICEGKPNIGITSFGKSRVFVDPNSKAQHTFYTLNVINKKGDESCTAGSMQCIIYQYIYYSETQNVTSMTEIDKSTINIPSLKAGQIVEIEAKVDFFETGYYKIQWELDASNAVDESDEEDNTIEIGPFDVFID